MAPIVSNAAKPRLTTQLTKKIQSVDIASDTIIKLDDVLQQLESMEQIWEAGRERDKNKLGTNFKKLIAVVASIKTNLNQSLKLNGNLSLAKNLISTKKAMSNAETQRQQLHVPNEKRKQPFQLRINETTAQAESDHPPKKKQKKLPLKDLKASKIDKFIEKHPPQSYKHYTVF